MAPEKKEELKKQFKAGYALAERRAKKKTKPALSPCREAIGSLLCGHARIPFMTSP
jgi:hypothetical protein